MIGGYQIINLGNKELTDEATIIKGVYNLIEGTKKPILLTNVNVGGTEIHNFFPQVHINDGNFELPWIMSASAVGRIIVNDDDEVTYVTD